MSVDVTSTFSQVITNDIRVSRHSGEGILFTKTIHSCVTIHIYGTVHICDIVYVYDTIYGEIVGAGSSEKYIVVNQYDGKVRDREVQRK